MAGESTAFALWNQKSQFNNRSVLRVWGIIYDFVYLAKTAKRICLPTLTEKKIKRET